tara:strand:+ start:33092 stop:34489 length:1398 start_codon:yes stop_codon:yes gene_type:complete
MSLSKEILQGTYQGVLARLDSGESPNVIDEYGYTPLIHAVVIQNFDIVFLLLERHARVDILDSSGQTALHWAVDMGNYAITELLLKFKANPNAYSASGQPILFYPLLRKDKPLAMLLAKHGADLTFTKDFIAAKLIGHRFSLQGYCDIVTTDGLFLEVDMEGFYLEFTLSLIQKSLRNFTKSYAGRNIKINEQAIAYIIIALKHAAHLREFKHISKDVEANKETIYKLVENDLLLLPVSFEGHAITFIKHGKLFAKCDRGVHKMTDPIVIHRVNNPMPLTRHFYKNLLYKRQTRKYIQRDLPIILDLKPYNKLPITHQITGNCSWANVEASIPTMLYMLLNDQAHDKTEADKLVKKVMNFYYTWLDWDKDKALEDFLRDFETLALKRQQAKAALLGEVLFQACSPQAKADLKRAHKILAILKRREFHFVVRSYLQVFTGGLGSSHGRRFVLLLKECGFKPTDFKV